MNITLITGNTNKARELSSLIGAPLANKKLRLVEPQSLIPAEVAEAKAAEAFRQLGTPVLVDDTGFAVEAWNGLPGALIAHFLDSVGLQGLLDMASHLTDRSVKVETALAYADADGVQVFVGVKRGQMTTAPRGTNGFGYDSIFVPDGSEKTYAEMGDTEKNAQSMRAEAASALRAGLGLAS